METSFKTGFAQIFSCCPKNLSRPKFGGTTAPLAPPARSPMIVLGIHSSFRLRKSHTGYFCVTIAIEKNSAHHGHMVKS